MVHHHGWIGLVIHIGVALKPLTIWSDVGNPQDPFPSSSSLILPPRRLT